MTDQEDVFENNTSTLGCFEKKILIRMSQKISQRKQTIQPAKS